MARDIKFGDTVRYQGKVWNVAQVHTSDRSADIWRVVDGNRTDINVSLSALIRITTY